MENNYYKLGIMELRQVAKNMGIKYTAYYNKFDLIKKIIDVEDSKTVNPKNSYCLDKKCKHEKCKNCEILLYYRNLLYDIVLKIDKSLNR